jgi:hypothetical protein
VTQPANVFSVYDASATTGVGRGNREDLVNTVYDISPTETPIFSALSRTTATAVLHEWTTDALATAAANEQVEGDDATITAAQVKSRLNNRCAISTKTPGVTRTQQKVNKTGMQDEMAYQVGKHMKELKRDIEVMLTANTAKVAGNDTTARKSAGLPTWLKDNVNRGSGGSNPTGDGSNTATDGTQRAFQESFLLEVSQECYDNGGEPTMLVVGTFNKRAVSGFAGNQNRNTDASDKKLINSVMVYEDDFNTLKVVPDRFSRSRDAFLIDPEYAKLAYLDDFDVTDLAKTGDNMRKLITVEWTLEVSNPAAHGIVADLTTS